MKRILSLFLLLAIFFNTTGLISLGSSDEGGNTEINGEITDVEIDVDGKKKTITSINSLIIFTILTLFFGYILLFK